MSVSIGLLIWYALGIVGCVFGTLSDLSKGHDYKLSDVFECLFVALIGPVALFLGFSDYIKSSGGKFNPVLIKGKR